MLASEESGYAHDPEQPATLWQYEGGKLKRLQGRVFLQKMGEVKVGAPHLESSSEISFENTQIRDGANATKGFKAKIAAPENNL